MTDHPHTPLEHIEPTLIEDGRVLRIVLNRPKANILSMAMMGELSKVLTAHQDDPHIRMVVLQGAGGNFSFGASVEEHRRDRAAAMLTAFHAFSRQLASYPVPVACLAEGRCLGGAFEVALCCHLVFATPTTRFACPEIKLGVFPPVLAVLGHHRLGGALAERLLLTGSELLGTAAERVGFVTALFDGDDPEAALLEWYRAHLAPLSAHSLREATRAAREGSGMLESLAAPLDAAERRYVERLVGSHDGNEGIEAFIERRPPRWEDR